MTSWPDPPRRLLNALARVKKDKAEAKGQTEEILIRTISKVTSTGYIIDGVEVQATGIATGLQAGIKVPVVFRNKRPVVIFSHSARRAVFPFIGEITGEVIEELFFDQTFKAGNTIFFRNFDQVTDLQVQKQLPGGPFQLGQAPGRLKWGMRDDSFITSMGGQKYAIFTLNRNANNVYRPKTKAVATLARVEDLKQNTKLVGVINVTVDNTHSPPGATDFSVGVPVSFTVADCTTQFTSEDIAAGKSSHFEIQIAFQSIPVGNGVVNDHTWYLGYDLSVQDVFLDHRLHVLMSCTIVLRVRHHIVSTFPDGHKETSDDLLTFGFCQYGGAFLTDCSSGESVFHNIRFFGGFPPLFISDPQLGSKPYGITGDLAVTLSPIQGSQITLASEQFSAGYRPSAGATTNNPAVVNVVTLSTQVVLHHPSIPPGDFTVDTLDFRTRLWLNNSTLYALPSDSDGFSSFTLHHALTIASDLRVSVLDFKTLTLTQIGKILSNNDILDIVLLDSDFIYRYKPGQGVPANEIHGFLRLWDFGTGIVDPTIALPTGFPRVDDSAMSRQGDLLALETGQSDGTIFDNRISRIFHVVNDVQVLGVLGRYRTN